MPPKNSMDWMLSEAVSQLARAERMHRQFFRLSVVSETQASSWEPPIDVLETRHELLIYVALPGVDPDEVEAVIADGTLMVRGERTLPPALRDAHILRLELPHGRFERRIVLPAGRYAISRSAENGCIVLRLAKSL
jgi:HSP20 family protein